MNKNKLDRILEEKGLNICPSCEQVISQGDIAWNNMCTEAGTPHCSLFCQCPKCFNEIFYIESWYPDIEDLYDVCCVLDEL